MSRWMAVTMLLGGGLFAGVAVSIAYERVPAWRSANLSEFRSTFAHTLRRVDRLQPALLTACLAATIGFATVEGGAARMLALVAAAGFLAVLLGSAAWLVPLQRRLVAPGQPATAELERDRTRWLRGHAVRTIIGVAALTLAILAATA